MLTHNIPGIGIQIRVPLFDRFTKGRTVPSYQGGGLRHHSADILQFLMMREANPDPFVTWCALMWDIWLQDQDEEILNRLYILVVELVPEGFSGISREWIHLIAHAVYRYKGKGEHVEDWVCEVPGEDEIAIDEIKTQFRKLAALETVKQEDLMALGSAPAGIPDRLIIELQDAYQFSETFPVFDPSRVTTNLDPQRHMLSYTYHPYAPTEHEAFGLEVDDLTKFLNDIVNMAATFHHNNPGGDFLRVDAAHRLLQGRKDGGGVLMALAWQRIEELVGDNMNKALAGKLFDEL